MGSSQVAAEGLGPSRGSFDHRVVLARISNIIVWRMRALGLQGDPSPSSSFETLGLSSLDVIRILLEVEEAFEISFPEDEVTQSNFSSAEAICRLVARHVASASMSGA